MRVLNFFEIQPGAWKCVSALSARTSGLSTYNVKQTSDTGLPVVLQVRKKYLCFVLIVCRARHDPAILYHGMRAWQRQITLPDAVWPAAAKRQPRARSARRSSEAAAPQGAAAPCENLFKFENGPQRKAKITLISAHWALSDRGRRFFDVRESNERTTSWIEKRKYLYWKLHSKLQHANLS